MEKCHEKKNKKNCNDPMQSKLKVGSKMIKQLLFNTLRTDSINWQTNKTSVKCKLCHLMEWYFQCFYMGQSFTIQFSSVIYC